MSAFPLSWLGVSVGPSRTLIWHGDRPLHTDSQNGADPWEYSLHSDTIGEGGGGDYCGVIMLYNSLPVYPGTICVTYFWSPQLRVREQYAGLLSSSSSSLVLFGEG